MSSGQSSFRLPEPIDLSRSEPPKNYALGAFDRAAAECRANYHRYPIRELETIEQRLSTTLSGTDRIGILVKGIDSCVDMILHHSSTSLTPLVFAPTFSGFLERINAWNARYESINLGIDYVIEPPHLEAIHKGHLLLLANPANPTGTIFGRPDLDEICQRVGLALVDETYLDFANTSVSYRNFCNSNVLTFMSFSKAYCMAGARLGFLSGPAQLISQYRRSSFRHYAPIDSFSLAMVEFSVFDLDYKETCVRETIGFRENFLMRLRNAGFETRDTQTNFVLVRCDPPVTKVAESLKNAGLIVRTLQDVGVDDWIRITVPANERQKDVIRKLKEGFSNASQRVGRSA